MKEFPFIFLLYLIPSCLGDLLKKITDTQYASMPPLKHWDPFTKCMMQEGGVYCTGEAKLVSDEPNELLQMMHTFSASAIRHYNYTIIDRGYCITQRCKELYTGNTTSELHDTMEACLNKTLSEEYGLEALLTRVACFHHGEKKHSIDSLDIYFGAFVFVLVAVNIAGTLYDCRSTKKDKSSLLMCFSLRANWKNLKAPWPSDVKAQQLKGINGLRVMTSIVVIAAHAFIPQFLAIENPQHMEYLLENFGQFIHIHIAMQTFFFLSGFFLAYSTQVSKAVKNGKALIKAIFLRWLRLTPVAFLMLLVTATWFRFTPLAPSWQEVIGDEVQECRQYWWYFFFSVNNYLNNSQCSLQSWSNATDWHMHIIGLTIIMLSPSKKARNRALWVFFVFAVVMPGLVTYYYDLTGIAIIQGDLIRNVVDFVSNATFNYQYKRTHTNMPCFVMGMALGYLIFDWQQDPAFEAKVAKYRKYRYSFLYWSLFPLMLALVSLSGLITKREGPVAPMSIRLFLVLTQKPLWGLLLGLIIVGLVIKIEKLRIYSGVLESNIWVPLSKLSFCAYNVQVVIIKWMQTQNTSLSVISDLQLNPTFFGTITLIFLAALIVWLFVEAPLNNLIRKLFPDKKPTLDVLNVSSKKE